MPAVWRRPRNLLLLLTTGLVGLLVGLLYGLKDLREKDEQAISSAYTNQVLSRVPDLGEFELVGVDGQKSQLPVGKQAFVLNFWATWCPPCLHEMPLLDQAHAQGVPVYGVAVDSREAVVAFLEKNPVGYPIVIAGLNGGVLLSEKMGNTTQAMPFTIKVGEDGQGGVSKTGVFADLGEIMGFYNSTAGNE